jgi:hypothetical protein
MSLVIGKKETRKITVNAEEPGDFAEVKKHSFDVEFKILPREVIDGLTESSKAGDSESTIRTVISSIVDVKGVKDVDGLDVPFSQTLLDALESTPWVYTAILNAFFAVQGGKTQSELYRLLKAKN